MNIIKTIARQMLALFLSAALASAACTGSGLTWSCPVTATPADVNAAINSASNGATITFATGTYPTWGGSNNIVAFSNSKGVQLVCATVPNCIVPSTGTVIGLPQYAVGTNTNLYRISGFTFNYNDTNRLIWFAYAGDCGTTTAPCTMTQVRIDHNVVNATNTSGGMVFISFADQASFLYTFGVADHDTLNAPSTVEFLEMIGNTITNPLPSSLGTGNNFFVENVAINITNMTNAGQSIVDSWGDARIVWRYNTWTNGLWAAHGVTHNGGPASQEVYNSQGSMVGSSSVGQGNGDGYRFVHHQGSGLFVAFGNTFTPVSGQGHSSSPIEMLHYRDYPNGIDGALPPDAAQCNGTVNGPADAPLVIDGNRPTTAQNQGYPCWRQPGRDPATGNYMPMYAWNNAWSDGTPFVNNGGMNVPDGGYGSPDYYPQHMQNNRDWFLPVAPTSQSGPNAPFNGTTGMGFGTLANRPTTCTTSTESALGHGAAGVGYFATNVGPQGTLYTCSATNTWTVYYTPYTYPHPLVSSSGGGLPAPATSVQVVIQ